MNTGLADWTCPQPDPSEASAGPAMTLQDLEEQILRLQERGASVSVGVGAPDDQAARLRALVSGERATEAEAFRPAEQASPVPADRPYMIAVASGKGGVGKTNVSVNLSAGLAGLGYRVALLDADLGTANADVLCGINPVARLDHVMGPDGLGFHDGGRRTIRDILVDAPGGFKLIPGSAGIARMADLTSQERRRLMDLMSEISADTDILVVDTAAGVGRGVTSMVNASDLCVVVCTPEPTAVTDAYALIKCATSPEAGDTGQDRKFGLLVNQAQDNAEARGVHVRIRAVCDRFLGVDLPMLGWIAQDVRVSEAVRARRPFLVRSPDAEASRNISSLSLQIAQLVGPARGKTPEKPRKTVLARALRRLLGIE